MAIVSDKYIQDSSFQLFDLSYTQTLLVDDFIAEITDHDNRYSGLLRLGLNIIVVFFLTQSLF